MQAVVPPVLCLLGSFAEAQYVASRTPAHILHRPSPPVPRLNLGARQEQGMYLIAPGHCLPYTQEYDQAAMDLHSRGSPCTACITCIILEWQGMGHFAKS